MSATVTIDNLVQRIDVGLGRGDDDVGIRTLAVDHPAIFFHPDRDFALRVRAGGNGID